MKSGVSSLVADEAQSFVHESVATISSKQQQHHPPYAPDSSLVNWHILMSALADLSGTSSLSAAAASAADALGSSEQFWFHPAAQPLPHVPGGSRSVITFMRHVVRTTCVFCR